ncbi:hypothetical protein QYM36_016905 [Artemia franciscana]|uniref:Uncharacterized protein n=1 Tax=Artemia franciscana TaxID=6661 RepID=A0AA88H4G7_ARTSF|nr:hypothetical protein QYM36_016905 [Artemia franciscana]
MQGFFAFALLCMMLVGTCMSQIQARSPSQSFEASNALRTAINRIEKTATPRKLKSPRKVMSDPASFVFDFFKRPRDIEELFENEA